MSGKEIENKKVFRCRQNRHYTIMFVITAVVIVNIIFQKMIGDMWPHVNVVFVAKFMIVYCKQEYLLTSAAARMMKVTRLIGLLLQRWLILLVLTLTIVVLVALFLKFLNFFMFLNIQIYLVILKTYYGQFTLTTKKSLHIMFKKYHVMMMMMIPSVILWTCYC